MRMNLIKDVINRYDRITFHSQVFSYVVVIFIWWNPFISSGNLDEVITYNHMTVIFLRSRSHVKVSMVLMRADYFFYTQLYMCVTL